MLERWLAKYIWRPFEMQARLPPFWPLGSVVDEVAPGVKCIRIGNSVTRSLSRMAGGHDYSVSYVVNDTVMIDTGFAWTSRVLDRTVTTQGWDKSITTVFNTHYHEDHIGNNDVAERICHARFLGSDITSSYARLPARLAWYRRFLFGPLRSVRIDIAADTQTVAGVEYQVIATPGHCPGHICVYVLETGWLFSGDLFVAPDLDTQLPDVDGPNWIKSLEHVMAMPVKSLFDAHGTVVHGEQEVRSLLRLKCDLLVDIRDRVRENLDASSSVEDLTSRVFRSKTLAERIALGDGWLSVLTNSEFSRHNLVESFARQMLAEKTDR